MYFLARLKETNRDKDAFRYNLSAFLSAFCSVPGIMNIEFQSIPGFMVVSKGDDNVTQINGTLSNDKQALDVAAALQKFNRISLAQDLKKAEEERKQVLEHFPLEAWPTMPLERYALGLGGKDSFSWWMEWGTEQLGSISGGSAEKHLIYKHKTRSWVFDSAYQNEQEAWEVIRSAFVKAFQLAQQEQFDAIDALEPFKRGYAIVVKVMYVYFPEQFLPIYSAVHTAHFLQVLKHPLIGRLSEWRGVRLNRALLEAVQGQPGLRELSHLEVMWFLYQFYDPRTATRIVKITMPSRKLCNEGSEWAEMESRDELFV